MTAAEFRKSLKGGLSGGYLFCGDEEYMKRFCLAEARKAVCPGGDNFGIVMLDSESPPGRLEEELSSPPFMGVSGRKLVELHGVDFGALPQSGLDELCAVLSAKNAYATSVVIIYALPGELDVGRLPKMPSKTFAALSGAVTPVVFDYEAPAALSKWIARHFAADSLTVTQEACALLLGLSGRDMTRLSGEIEKLSALTLSRGLAEVTADAVREVVGRVTDMGAFDFANAVLDRDIPRAMTLLAELKNRRERPEMIFASFVKVFTELYTVKALFDSGVPRQEISSRLKLHDFKTGMYLSAAAKTTSARLEGLLERCADTDIKLKSSSLDSEMLLDRLVAGMSL